MNTIKRNLNTTQKTSRRIVRLFSFYMIALFVFSACDQDEFVEVDLPPQLATAETIFSTLSTAETAVAGVYALISSGEGSSTAPDTGNGYSSTLALYADELRLIDLTFGPAELYSGFLTPEAPEALGLWAPSFKLIQATNRVLEGITLSTTIPEGPEKDQLLGEAYFMRAFSHFFLTRLFGEVPYIETSDFEINRNVSRLPEAEVYINIIEDLQLAISLLQDEYTDDNRTRANKSTAMAILARVYLIQEDWVNVEAQSTLVLENPLYSWESSLENVFITDSPSTIWQLDVRGEGLNSEYGGTFGGFFANPITDETLAVFEDGDLRSDIYVGEVEDFFTGDIFKVIAKYKEELFSIDGITRERYKFLRMGELYLTRAEARAQLNNIAGAQSDLNIVRERAGLAATTASNREDLIAAVMQERRIELLGESGHRWFDLKRTGRADEVLSILPQKTNWVNPRNLLFPVPVSDRLLNPELSQNTGY